MKLAILTLDSALTIKLGTQHPQPENQHGEWKDNSNAETYAPDSMKMILSSDRKNDEEDRRSQGTTKLTRISVMAESRTGT